MHGDAFDARIVQGAPLAPRTTLELGGPARHLVRADDDALVHHAVRWSRDRGEALLVLGSGSNVVVADEGFPGLVVEMATRGVALRRVDDRVHVTASAGEPWDALVARTVDEGLAGLECLSGIPGLVGATPIQNVGAYGQEVADTIVSVRTLDRRTGEVETLASPACDFGYRDSAFRRDRDTRRIVLAVTYALTPNGTPTLRYGELTRALRADGRDHPSLHDVRTAVLALRRKKSMVIDPADENRRSVGSFFTNPIVPAATRDEVVRRALEGSIVRHADEVPQYAAGDGRVKLAAAWLIERAGVARGERRGPVGVSTRHALSLVHHGGGTTAALLALAESIRDRVRARFELELHVEPTCVGFADSSE